MPTTCLWLLLNLSAAFWLIKFTSKNLALGDEEGLCEAVYLQMAEQAKCQPPIWQLIKAPNTSGASAWLALKRFDYVTQ